MKVTWETLAAAVVVAASILFVGRYQISTAGTGASPGNGSTFVYRLDRWTGNVVECEQSPGIGYTTRIECPVDVPPAPGNPSGAPAG